jgi:dTDP-4-amino-4,6-dideoxygalactose transaminase
MALTKIPFNKPYLTGQEFTHIREAVNSGKISGDGKFTKLCHSYIESKWRFSKCLLTTSCTDALEMAAILIGIEPGDEIIMPSYTFVSTANAFALRGARIIFADSKPDEPNLDVSLIESLITSKTKAIVAVHYAGISCDMDPLLGLAKKYNLFVIEDAAQGIDSYYKGRALGSIGDIGAFSFHETKNIQCGEGGAVLLNNPRFFSRAEILREKGTNRSAFFRGEVDKYSWVDVGSSFLPSDILAAFLFAQLQQVDKIQEKRKKIWASYSDGLSLLLQKDLCRLPVIPSYATNNAHMFYIVCNSIEHREKLIEHLKSKNIHAVFHYLSLHKSPYHLPKHDNRELPWSDYYSDRLVRLPLWFEMSDSDTGRVIDEVLNFYNEKS